MPSLKDRVKATRHRTEDDDDDGVSALLAASLGPPSQCVVFNIPDEDETPPEEQAYYKQKREWVIGKLRALNLNVDQYVNKSNTLLFVKISAPDTVLRYEAEERRIRLRLKDVHGGALCAYSREIESKQAFDKPFDGFELFCSAQQLKIIDEVCHSEPYGIDDPFEAAQNQISFAKLQEEDPVPGLPIVAAYFPLHHDRMRLRLLNEWARAFMKPQPLELVREYLGEKLALFFTWMGYYCTMLWVPALIGLYMTVQDYNFYRDSLHLSNPYNVVYAIVIAIWSNMFSQLWKNLESSLKYKWDTLDFEDLEEIRKEFKENENTEKDSHVNEITDELDDFYYDEGTFFPPTGRARDQLVTYTVIIVFNLIAVILFFVIWENFALPLMKPGDVLFGGILCGVAFSIVSILFDSILDGVPELELKGLMGYLVARENWKTFTEHEDAVIMKTFYFKILNKYFALLMIAFGVNYIDCFGGPCRCPHWQCMPVLEVVYISILLTELVWGLSVAYIFPLINKYFDSLRSPNTANQGKVHLTPQEEQYEWLVANPVIDFYKDRVYQFGYISLFGMVSPFMSFVCLISSLVDLRSKALQLLTKNRRPDATTAADIGSYQVVLDTLSTLSIITNAGIVGVCSFSLYFYFPTMTDVDCLWATAVLEHMLIVIKIFISSYIPEESEKAKEEWEVQQEKKLAALDNWNIKENELEDPTPW